MPAAVPPPQPADARLVRLASRLAISAIVALVVVVLFGSQGWKGWTAFAFVVAIGLAVASGLLFGVAAYVRPRR